MNRERQAKRFVIVLALSAQSALIPSSAQQTTATLIGTVTDPSGRSMPGVMVRIDNIDTNAIRTTRTDQDGNYYVPYLPTGSWRIVASKEGFKTREVDRLILQVDQIARVDFTMSVG